MNQDRAVGRPRIGRPPSISREAIVDAVLELGLDRATTVAVADQLGVDQSTLYGHIRDRNDMLDAAADAAIARTAWPAPAAHWRVHLLAFAQTMWEMFERNPGLAVHLRSMSSIPPALAGASVELGRYLMQAMDCDLRFAALVIDTLGDMIADSSIIAASLDAPAPHAQEPTSGREQLAAAVSAIAAGAGEFAAAYAEVIREAAGEPGRPSLWWCEKVELVLDGIEHRLAQADGSAGSGAPARAAGREGDGGSDVRS